MIYLIYLSYITKVFAWFHSNRLKSNTQKCNLITSSTSPVEFQMEYAVISSVNRVKLLGVYIDGRPDFDYQVSQICKEASKSLHVLSRSSKYMDLNKRRMLMKAFIISQFSNCPLVWMFHSRNTENRVNKICKRALRIVYYDSPYLNFDQMLVMHRFLSFLMSEFCIFS